MSFIATRAIKALNLNVQKGQPLPNRFQSRLVIGSLKREFGDDAFEEFTHANTKYIAIERDELDALYAEIAELRSAANADKRGGLDEKRKTG